METSTLSKLFSPLPPLLPVIYKLPIPGEVLQSVHLKGHSGVDLPAQRRLGRRDHRQRQEDGVVEELKGQYADEEVAKGKCHQQQVGPLLKPKRGTNSMVQTDSTMRFMHSFLLQHTHTYKLTFLNTSVHPILYK